MSRKRELIMLVAGVAAGMCLAPTAAQAVSEHLTATPSANTVYVDGQRVELEAYAINGSNYVKLRDVGKLMDFNVYWGDGAVQIDSDAPYTGEAPVTMTVVQPAAPEVTPPPASSKSYTISTDHWSREDFSQQANPAVFTGLYDRELYNTFRQALVDEGSNSGGPVAYTMVSDSEYSAVKNLMGRLDGVLRYEHYVPDNLSNYYEYLDFFAVSGTLPDNYQAPLDFIGPVIDEANRLKTDREKVAYLNDYLCSLLTYKKDKTAAIADIFSRHSAELPAACGTYARAFKFLCQAADIPCFTFTTGNHVWNMVYVGGQWLHVDVSTNDANGRHVILLTSTVPNRTDTAPEATAFLKELLVPGSTR